MTHLQRELWKAIAAEAHAVTRLWHSNRSGRRQIESLVEHSTPQQLSPNEAAITAAQLAIIGRIAARIAEHRGLQSTGLDWACKVIPPTCRSIVHDWPLPNEKTARLDQLIHQLTQSLSVTSPHRRHPAPPSTRKSRTRGRSELSRAGATHLSVDAALLNSYEAFAVEFDRSRRRHRGVFYTPQPIVSFMVQRLSQFVATDLKTDVAAGFVQSHHPLRIWDPSVGTGAFIVELVRVIHAVHRQTTRSSRRWQHFARTHLLDNLHGTEVLLPPLFVAAIRLAIYLSDSECKLDGTWPMPLAWCDSLGEDVNRQLTPNVIVGNPPYSANSANSHKWVQQLLHGNLPQSAEDYYSIGGRPLNEKKTWLHDDYVKFLRVAQMHVELRGHGIVAMITNHGYLENATFRGMRESVLNTFPLIDVIDLHGNRKKGESAPQQMVDQNVFRIDQGVAISFWRRPHSAPRRATRYAELWGSREQKLERIRKQDLTTHPISPSQPQYWLSHRTETQYSEYEAGIGIDELFMTFATAPVTARDHLVVGRTKRELVARIKQFTDPTIDDETIRNTYFGPPRSSRYPRGDTRSWKLREVRQQLRSESNWDRRIVECQYRPCDVRYIFWHPAMIDWPRRKVTDHLIDGNGLALVTRRQMPAGQPRNYFWVTRLIGLDGLIRSDSLGSETLFPLWTAEAGKRRSNLTNAAFDRFDRLFSGMDRTDDLSARTCRIASYAYGIFYSTAYRKRFANLLANGYPRIPIPKKRTHFEQIADQGHRLIQSHSMRLLPMNGPAWRRVHVGKGYPKLDHHRIHFSSRTSVEVDESLSNWTVGAHCVLKKWLTARRDQNLGRHDLQQLDLIIRAATVTRQCVVELDRIAAAAGGFARGFQSS